MKYPTSEHNNLRFLLCPYVQCRILYQELCPLWILPLAEPAVTGAGVAQAASYTVSPRTDEHGITPVSPSE